MLHPFTSEQLLCRKLQPVGTLVQVGEAEMVKKDGALSEANLTFDFDISSILSTD